MVLVIAAVLLAVILVLALIALGRVEQAQRAAVPVRGRADKLPAGAEAALWSIIEAVPDPRNHLALTRDLTGEVRIAGTVLDPSFRARTIVPPPPPVRAGGASVRIIGQHRGDVEGAVTPLVEDQTGEHRLDVAS